MDGTVRCYSNEVLKIAKEKIIQIANLGAEFYGCKASVLFYEEYPAVVNHALQTEDFTAFASALLGPSAVSSEGLPIAGSEDFSFFLEERPGCFFFLGLGRPQEEFLHTSNYDYNDDMISFGAWLWVKFIQHKFKQ